MSFVRRVDAALAPLADPVKAASMSAYMKNQFPFLGVQTPERRQTTCALLRDLDGDPLAIARALWRKPPREFQYVGCDLLAGRADTLPAAALADVLQLVTRKSWWDTVDALAHTIGTLVRRFPVLAANMDRLIDDPNLWLRRAALLHQLGARNGVDRDRLFDYCLRRAGETEFFIRKAIGWALRDYARCDPVAVSRFLGLHGSRFSPLSVREASKNLTA